MILICAQNLIFDIEKKYLRKGDENPEEKLNKSTYEFRRNKT